MTVVDRILTAAKEKHVPVARLEKGCGFANGYLRKLQKGTLPSDRLEIVAEFLEVDPRWLATGEEPPKKELMQVAMDRQIFSLYGELDAKRKEQVNDFIVFMWSQMRSEKKEAALNA